MARALATVGCPVVYVEPWWHDRAVTTEKDSRLVPRSSGSAILGPRLHLLR